MKIGVVGAGSSGTVAALELCGITRQIDLYDPGNYFGGRALSSADNEVILNTSLSVTDIRDGNGKSFSSFLGYPENPNHLFIHRHKAKDFLRHSWEAVNGCSRKRLKRYRVTDIRVVNQGVEIISKEQSEIYDFVILATGAPFRQFFDETDDFDVPMVPAFPNDELCNINHEANIAIAGSSLSAVDAALTRFRKGHRGRIIMLSKTGNLPAVRRGFYPLLDFGIPSSTTEVAGIFCKLLPKELPDCPHERFMLHYDQSVEGGHRMGEMRTLVD